MQHIEIAGTRPRIQSEVNSNRLFAMAPMRLVGALLILSGIVGFFVLLANTVGTQNYENPDDPKIQFRQIKDLRVGMRIASHNPNLDATDRLQFEEPTEIGWQLLSMKLPCESGEINIEMIRPDSWIADRNARVGGKIGLEFSELGVSGDAKVLKIAPCPKIDKGDGHIITSTFVYPAIHPILDVKFKDNETGSTTLIGVTTNHPFWSEKELQFVRIGDLDVGDQVRQFGSGISEIVEITRRDKSELVYNIEVSGEHVYFVSKQNLLVHNNCGTDIVGKIKNLRLKGWTKGGSKRHEKHWDEWDPPFTSASDYEKSARSFAKESKDGQVSAQVGNWYYKFDPSDGRILTLNSKNRTITTYYKANNKADPWQSWFETIETGFRKYGEKSNGAYPENVRMWVEGVKRAN